MKASNVVQADGHLTVSTSVLRRAVSGDQAAYRRIVELYGGLVFRWCTRQGLQHHDAQNVFQEVFLSVSQNLRTFDRTRPEDSFRGWIRTITRNKLMDYFRQLARTARPAKDINPEEVLSSLQSPDDDSEESLREDLTLLYHKAIELLQAEFSERDFGIVTRVLVDGEPVKDVAGSLKISTNTVYVVVCRVRKRLKDEFGDLGDVQGDVSGDPRA